MLVNCVKNLTASIKSADSSLLRQKIEGKLKMVFDPKGFFK
jgi:hypothetical protein